MKNKAKLSKRTLGLLVATLVLVLATGGMGARAALSIFSQDYNAEFKLDHLNVALLENGDIAAEKNPGEDIKVVDGGKLLAHGHDKDGLKDGRFEPGRIYKEEIAAKNMRDIPEYVRLSIRTYWVNPDGSKNTDVDPSLIELMYNGEAFNAEAWQHNESEDTTERKVFYLTNVLEGGKDSDPVVNQLRINNKIMDDLTVTPSEPVDGQIIYTYEYEYNGLKACIEADVQSIQTHNVSDALTSLWGVENVTAADGKITVAN